MDSNKQYVRYLSILIIFFCVIAFLNAKYKLQYVSAPENVTLGVITNAPTDIVYWESGFKSHLQEDPEGQLNILFEGQVIFHITEKNLDQLKETSNTSFKSAIYSLAFLRASIQDSSIFFLEKEQLNKINDLVLSVISLSKDILLTDPYILHDHPVAERLETLLLYLPICKNLQLDTKLTYKMEAHVHHLFKLLSNDKYFTYYMNHGLMQLRSQLAYIAILKDVGELNNVYERIQDVYPIFVGQDGSILESATGYQLYIYRQFCIISNLLERASNGELSLADQLRLQEKYLSSVISEDGFLQGLGDSYSEKLDKSELGLPSLNQFFHYDNGIAGVNINTERNDKLNLLFISLDNQPNIHKLPEDLSVQLYYNSPFFVNTGAYSYEKGDALRKFILSGASQNGPKFLNEEVLASRILFSKLDEEKAYFKGRAASKKDTLYRMVSFHNFSPDIHIRDSSSIRIETQFLVNPTIELVKNNDTCLLLVSKTDTIIMKSDTPLQVDKSPISIGYQQQKEVDRIYATGEVVNITIVLPHRFDFREIANLTPKKTQATERKSRTNALKRKYPNSLVIKKINTTYSLMGLIAVFLIFLNTVKPIRPVVKYALGIPFLLAVVIDIFIIQLFLVEIVYGLRGFLL